MKYFIFLAAAQVLFAKSLVISDNNLISTKDFSEFSYLTFDDSIIAFQDSDNEMQVFDYYKSFKKLTSSFESEFNYGLADSEFRYDLLELFYKCSLSNKSWEKIIIDTNKIPIIETIHFFFQKANQIVLSQNVKDKFHRNKNFLFFPINYKLSFKDGLEILEQVIKFEDYLKKSRKLKILWPNMHSALTDAMVNNLEKLGHELIKPRQESFQKNEIGFLVNAPGFDKGREVNYNDVLESPPDLIAINCLQNEQASINLIEKIRHENNKKIPLIHFSGNTGTCYQKEFVKFLISVDVETYKFFPDAYKIFWYPNLDYVVSNKIVHKKNDLCIRSYLNQHYHLQTFQPAKTFFDLINQNKQDLDLKNIELWNRSDFFAELEKSDLTLQIKNHEGFGMTIIESMFHKTPVVLCKKFSIGKRLMHWSIPEKTAFFINDPDEFFLIIKNIRGGLIDLKKMQSQTRWFIENSYNSVNMLLYLESLLQKAAAPGTY